MTVRNDSFKPIDTHTPRSEGSSRARQIKVALGVTATVAGVALAIFATIAGVGIHAHGLTNASLGLIAGAGVAGGVAIIAGAKLHKKLKEEKSESKESPRGIDEALDLSKGQPKKRSGNVYDVPQLSVPGLPLKPTKSKHRAASGQKLNTVARANGWVGVVTTPEAGKTPTVKSPSVSPQSEAPKSRTKIVKMKDVSVEATHEKTTGLRNRLAKMGAREAVTGQNLTQKS